MRSLESRLIKGLQSQISIGLAILCILGHITLNIAQTPSRGQATPPSEVAAIEAYCKELDSYKKSNRDQARIFGNVASWDQSGLTLSAPSPKWKEFKTRKAREAASNGDNLYDLADVWVRDGKVVIAEFWSGSPSGDWSQSVVYYFREDGTLAKMRTTYSGFNVNPFSDPNEFGARLVQTRMYDTNGKLLQKRLQCFELGEKGRQRKCSGDYSHREGVIYKSVNRLPMYRLLNSGLQSSNEVAAIEAYTKGLEGFKKRNSNRGRIFGNIVSPNQETYPVTMDAPRYWQEFSTRKARESAPKGYDLYDGAEVWTKDGKIVIVQLEPNRFFGGGERVITYYFRGDGTLAKIRSQFYDLGIDGDVIKEIFFDTNGATLLARSQCLNVSERGKRRKVNCSRISSDYDAAVYKRVEELPFYSLLEPVNTTSQLQLSLLSTRTACTTTSPCARPMSQIRARTEFPKHQTKFSPQSNSRTVALAHKVVGSQPRS